MPFSDSESQDGLTNTPSEVWTSRKLSPLNTRHSTANHLKQLLNGITMQIWGGFLSVVGVAAVAVAFVVLNAFTLGVSGLFVASLGAASLLTGLGLFAAGNNKVNHLESMVVTEGHGLSWA